jgi:hypothetical protein
MVRACSLASLLVVTTANAQPVTRPEQTCRVTIALAPEDVRREIEAWVAAEPRCARELEVRVVPTDTGLYLSARDPNGRVRERIVPDAQSAAVLVVSWMADDSLGSTLPPSPVQVDLPAPPALPPLPSAPVHEEAALEVREGFRVRRHRSEILIGALGGEHARGVRAQVDLFGHRRWLFGIGGGWTREEQRAGEATSAQLRLLVGARYTAGRLSLRAQLGLGVDVLRGSHMDESERDMEGAHSVTPAAELGLYGSLKMTDAWGLVGGPILHVRGDGADPELSLFLGIARQL